MDWIRSFRTVGGVALLGLAILACAMPVQAQTTSASVSGLVTDPQGAMLPGAAVTLKSRTQGNVLTTTSGPDGRFQFAIVRPDNYTLKVTLDGFKSLEKANLVVSANDRLSAGTIALEIGKISEEVTVEARVSELQVESGERSYVLESEAIKNIANNDRALFNFATLVPGVAVTNGVGDNRPTQVSNLVVNGQRPNSNNMTIDGVANIDTGDNGGNMATTNIDAVAEFKVLTNSYQAEYGRAVGAQIQVVTKSGTQEFHGSGYWYGRRSDWNANSWTNNRNTPATPKAESSRNDYGFTLGGPVYIPGSFNADKKKLFFFWSEEWQKRKDPVGERVVRVPTALERAGDFSQSVDASGNPYPYIKDYTTNLPCSATDTRGCFQDGGVLGKIPTSRLYQPGIAALNLYPLPNATRGSGLNYVSQASGDAPRREDMVRLDFQPSDTWHVTARYMANSMVEVQPYGTTWAGAGGNIDTIDASRTLPGQNIMVSAQGILNSTTSVEFSVGRAHNELAYEINNPAMRRSAAGLSSFPMLYPDAVQLDYIPDFNFQGGRTSGNAARIQSDRGPFVNENTTWDVIGNIVKVAGKHSLKAGVYFQSSYKPQSPFASFNGQVNFTDNSQNPYDTNYGYSNAATGVFNTYVQASKYALPEWVYKNTEFYVQDNWKATSRLTLDFGVRFYYMTPQWDQTLAASTFLPGEYDQAQAALLYTPVCIGASPCSGGNLRGMDPRLIGNTTPTLANTVESRFNGRLVAGQDRFNGAFAAGQGVNDQMQSGSVFKVSPRFGFVFDLSGTGTTILRGGGGIFYDRPQGNMVFDQIANAPGMLQPQLAWGRLQDLSSAGGDPVPTLSMNPTAYDFDPPVVTAWNVGIQHKLWKAFTFDLAYVGSINKNLLEQDQINAVPLGAAYLPENQNPTAAASSVPGQTSLPGDFMRPYSGYNNIRLWGYTGESNYHSLQTAINRRFDNGLMFNVFYVYSKTLTTTSDDFQGRRPNSTDEENKRVNYSYASYDRPHNFAVNLVYQTPKVASGVLGVIANNWQVSGIYKYYSGVPYAVNFSVPGVGNTNFTGSGDIAARIVVTGDPGKGSTSDPYKMINTSAFAPPQTGSDGTESARFFMHAPAISNLDLSLSKAFPVGNRVKLEVRLDAFNALNHTQFSGVNSTANFAGLNNPTITNLPYNAAGVLTNQNGFGTVSGVYAPRQLQLVTRLTF